jgi:acyl dehydratase
MKTTFASVADLRESVGKHLGYSDWHVIDQDRVNLFADATGDHQWIHVDPERARSGPFGGAIAHGFLTLSLIPLFMAEVYAVEGVRMAVNYGLNKVRFPAVLPVGRRARGGLELVEVSDVEGGVQVVARVTVEVEGGEKPCCVAESVARLYV